MVAVNLYVDRMSPVQPVRVADVYSITQDRAAEYREAAAKIGLTVSEYTEVRTALSDGNAEYVVLPRHIDAMAGVHRRNGRVYALRNVVVPSGEMGWRIALSDGATVYVPRVCGNLSMNHPRAQLAKVPATVARHAGKGPARKIAGAPVPVAVFPVTPPVPAPVPVPVTFAAPAAAVAAAPVVAAAVPLASGAGTIAPDFVPLIPFVYGLVSRNTPSVVIPPCSAGSNTLGVCR